MRVLLVNPNTSRHITERMARAARAVMTPDESLVSVTATGAPQVVHSAETLRAANSNAEALVLAHAAASDAVLIAISLDGVAVELRPRIAPKPVIGITEAALMSASLSAQHIGLLTLGPALLPLYRERVEQIGLAARVVAWQAPEAPAAYGAGAADMDAQVLDILATACRQLGEEGAAAVVLAGAVLCGYASSLSSRSGLAVFDGIQCAVGQARLLHGLVPEASGGTDR